MKKYKNTIKSLYIDSFNYIKTCKKFILAIIIIFFMGTIIGLILPLPQEIILQIMEMLKKILGQIEGKTTMEIIEFIFINNTKASLIGLVAGIFMGIVPIILALTNGYLLGFVMQISIDSEGIFMLWRLFPHGIFELPAIFISLGMGLHLGTFIFQKDTAKALKENIKNSLIAFTLIILPLLIIAATIEGILISLSI